MASPPRRHDVLAAAPSLSLHVVENLYGDLQLHWAAARDGGSAIAAPADEALAALPSDALVAALRRVHTVATRGVWLQLPASAACAGLVAAALAEGYVVHHAAPAVGAAAGAPLTLTLQRWCRAERNPTPACGHHAMGSAALVVRDSDGAVLAIRDRYDAAGPWRMPGGHVDAGECGVECAVRETREETGVHATAVGVLALLELQLPVRTDWAPGATPAREAATAGGADVADEEKRRISDLGA